MGFSRLVVLLVVIFTLAACSDSADTLDDTPDEIADEVSDDTTIDDEGRPVFVQPEAINGTAWTLMFGGGPEGEIVTTDGSPITMVFDGFDLSGTAACNSYGASYSLDEERFRITELGSEGKECEPAAQELERLYLGALEDVDGINVNGDELALSGMASELIFRRTTPASIDE